MLKNYSERNPRLRRNYIIKLQSRRHKIINNRCEIVLKNYSERRSKIMNNRREIILKNYSEGRPKIMNNRRENTLKNYSKRVQEGNKAKLYNKIIVKEGPRS